MCVYLSTDKNHRGHKSLIVVFEPQHIEKLGLATLILDDPMD